MNDVVQEVADLKAKVADLEKRLAYGDSRSPRSGTWGRDDDVVDAPYRPSHVPDMATPPTRAQLDTLSDIRSIARVAGLPGVHSWPEYWAKIPEDIVRNMLASAPEFAVHWARKVDWSTMSPREVYDAIKSAPKVAGPWTKNGGHVYRVATDGAPVVVSSHGDDGPFESGDYRLPDRPAADAALRTAGWILVDDEPKPA
jgi:hypothetical protein